MLHLVRPVSLLSTTCFAFIWHSSAELHAFMPVLCVWTCHFDSQQLIIRSPCVVSSVSDLHLLNLMTFRWNLILLSHMCSVWASAPDIKKKNLRKYKILKNMKYQNILGIMMTSRWNLILTSHLCSVWASVPDI